MKPKIINATLLLFSALGLMHTTLGYAADSVSFKETQKDQVKCAKVYTDPDTGDKTQDCNQITTSSYSISIKLTKPTFNNAGVYFTDFNPGASFSVGIGSQQFSGVLSDVRYKLTKKVLQATWKDINTDTCIKYDSDENCLKYKVITYGTYKLDAAPNKINFTLTGNYDGSGGQQALISACQNSGTGNITDQASVTINEIVINLPLLISCKVINTLKDNVGVNHDYSFNLSNVTIKGKLGAAQ